MQRRVKKEGFLEEIGKIDLLAIDELHIRWSPSFIEMIESLCHEKTAVIGLTATPWKNGLRDWFDSCVYTTTPPELLEQGYLVPVKVKRGSVPINMKDLVIDHKIGDYSDKTAAQAVQSAELYADVRRTYKDTCNGKRFIGFGASKSHAQALCNEFNADGIPCAVVFAETPAAVRENLFNAVRDGSLTGLWSVKALAEGLDIPALEVCMLCRPTMNANIYCQKIGRVLRPSPETGKVFAWILDFVGVTHKLGLPYDDRPYVLPEGKAKLSKGTVDKDIDEEKVWACDECGGINSMTVSVCHLCGAQKPKPKPKLIDNLKMQMEEVKETRALSTGMSLQTQQELMGALCWWLHMKGKKEGAGYFVWKNYFGIFPKPGVRCVAGKWVPQAQALVDFTEAEWRKYNRKLSYGRANQKRTLQEAA